MLSKFGVVLLTSPTPNRSKTELLIFNSVGGGETSSLSSKTAVLICIEDLVLGITFLVANLIEVWDGCEETFFFNTFNGTCSSSSSLSLETFTFLVITFFTLLITIKTNKIIIKRQN